jgi:ribosomal-protein-alanine N-acetyltransferase
VKDAEVSLGRSSSARRRGGPARAPRRSVPLALMHSRSVAAGCARRSTRRSVDESNLEQVIHGPRLDLVLLSGALLDALLANDRQRAQDLAEFALADEFPGDDEWVGKRRSQVVADPTWEPWSLRAIVLRDERRMVGSTSFHGPPGINALGTPGAAEFGYGVFPAFQRRGYATETGRAMLEWARQEHGVRHFISSIEPSNAPSLRVIEKLGFTRLELIVDDEAIFELRAP